MKYDITKPQPPKMPELGRGTDCIKLVLSQTSKDMHEPLVPMIFPILGAHMSGVEFHHSYPNRKGLCVRMALPLAKCVYGKDCRHTSLTSSTYSYLPTIFGHNINKQ